MWFQVSVNISFIVTIHHRNIRIVRKLIVKVKAGLKQEIDAIALHIPNDLEYELLGQNNLIQL